MEYQKIINLLDNTPKHPWVEIMMMHMERITPIANFCLRLRCKKLSLCNSVMHTHFLEKP